MGGGLLVAMADATAADNVDRRSRARRLPSAMVFGFGRLPDLMAQPIWPTLVLLIGLVLCWHDWSPYTSPRQPEPVLEMRLLLLGVGNVGQAFLKQILDAAPYHREVLGVELQIECIGDSTGVYVADDTYFSREKLQGIMALKESGSSGKSLAQMALKVDCSLSLDDLPTPYTEPTTEYGRVSVD